MSRLSTLAPRAAIAVLAALLSFSVQAQVKEVRAARAYGIGFLPTLVMEDQKLVEKHAKRLGAGEVAVKWFRFTGAAGVNDALLSGQLDFAAGGPQALAFLWERTRGNLDVRGLAGLNTLPMYLVTRNPDVKTIRDLTQKDRVVVPSVKVSSHAMVLQMLAAQTYGDGSYARLDPLTVAMPHPEAIAAMLSGRSEITAHFTSIPFISQYRDVPGMRTIVNSRDVFGGPTTLSVVWASARLRKEDPKLYQAFLDALEESVAFIARDRRAAANAYIRVSGDKSSSVEALEKILADPDTEFTTTPKNVMKYVDFMHKVGLLKSRPESWKDLFFPEIHHAAGS